MGFIHHQEDDLFGGQAAGLQVFVEGLEVGGWVGGWGGGWVVEVIEEKQAVGTRCCGWVGGGWVGGGWGDRGGEEEDDLFGGGTVFV